MNYLYQLLYLNFQDNACGLCLYEAYNNEIGFNNFIDDKATFDYNIVDFPYPNKWYSNYWYDWPEIGPKLIWGKISYWTSLFSFTWPNFDWHPAKEPYDIS